MPGWSVHSKVYAFLGLDKSLCRIIDRLVDVEPPTIREVLGEGGSSERLWVHFGFNRREFPFMYNYVLGKYGFSGVECLLAHFILDFIENCLKKGYTREMIVDSIDGLLEGYRSECRVMDSLCRGFEDVSREIRNSIVENMDVVIGFVREWLDKRILPIDELVNASTKILSLIVKAELIKRGYKGKKGGFHVKQEVFHRVFYDSKTILRKRVYEALLSNELSNIEEVIKSINNIIREVAEKRKLTIKDYTEILNRKREKNPEFEKFLRIINEVVLQAIKDYEDSMQ